MYITYKLIHVQQTSVLKSSSDLMDDMVILTLSPNNIEGKSEGLKTWRGFTRIDNDEKSLL